MTINLLIATDNQENAKNIADQLANDYKITTISVRSSKEDNGSAKVMSSDFDQYKPDILILAFTKLTLAEDYYAELYHHSQYIASIPHRTLLLCDQHEVDQAVLLHQQDHYDEYVVFWPEPYDIHQLPAALQRIGLDLEKAKAHTAYHELSKQVHRLTDLTTKINDSFTLIHGHIDTLNQGSEKMNLTQSNNLAKLLHLLSQGKFRELIDHIEAPSSQQLIKKLQQELILQPSQTLLAQPLLHIKTWLNDFKPQLLPHLKSISLLKTAAQNTPPTILMVDDDKFAHRLIKDALINENYIITFASSGLEALKSFRKKLPDIILMDLNMPEMGGIDTLSKIKASPTLTSIPVIMITGNNAKKDVIDSFQAGAADFIVKPISHGILLDKIKKLLQ